MLRTVSERTQRRLTLANADRAREEKPESTAALMSSAAEMSSRIGMSLLDRLEMKTQQGLLVNGPRRLDVKGTFHPKMEILIIYGRSNPA